MIHSLRSMYFALIFIAMSASLTSFSMIKEATPQALTPIENEAVSVFTKNLTIIDPKTLAKPDNLSTLSKADQKKFVSCRIEALGDFFLPCMHLQASKNSDIRAILIKVCAKEIDASILEQWATNTIPAYSEINIKNLAYIKEITQEALKIKIASAPKNNSPANCPQLLNVTQPLSFFAKCSIAAGAIGTVALVYYWYTTQKETEKA